MPVFDAMLEKAMRLCAADHGVLQIYEGETSDRRLRGVSEPFAD